MKAELLTISEFCAAANIGRTYTYQLIKEGKVKAIKIGRKTLVPRTALMEWIDSLKPYPSENRPNNQK